MSHHVKKNSFLVLLTFAVFDVQVGAGGLGLSLPRRRRGGRLLVSRQPDQGRRPGFQQRGQLHVTAAQVTPTRTAQAHDTGAESEHVGVRSGLIVQFAHSAGTAHSGHNRGGLFLFFVLDFFFFFAPPQSVMSCFVLYFLLFYHFAVVLDSGVSLRGKVCRAFVCF